MALFFCLEKELGHFLTISNKHLYTHLLLRANARCRGSPSSHRCYPTACWNWGRYRKAAHL